MKKALILICTLAVGAAAYAAPAKAARIVAHMSGTIEKYDSSSKTLTVKHDGKKETTFQLTDSAQVLSGKTKSDPASLAASTGHSVKVEYVMEGANRMAEKVDVSAKKK
jgi:hypothetical protein